DVVVDGSQDVGRAANQQDVGEGELGEKPAEGLPDGERVSEVDRETEDERHRDRPGGGAARGGHHVVERDLVEQQNQQTRRDGPGREPDEALLHSLEDLSRRGGAAHAVPLAPQIDQRRGRGLIVAAAGEATLSAALHTECSAGYGTFRRDAKELLCPILTSSG